MKVKNPKKKILENELSDVSHHLSRVANHGRIRFTPSPASQRSSIHHTPSIIKTSESASRAPSSSSPAEPPPPTAARRPSRPSPGKERRAAASPPPPPAGPHLRDWKRRRRSDMAIPLVLVVLPLGLLFLLSGLIVNTIQVSSLPPHRSRSARFVFHFPL